MPTIADYLKYANLQMAAEAFLAWPDGALKDDIKQALIDGNTSTGSGLEHRVRSCIPTIRSVNLSDGKAPSDRAFRRFVSRHLAWG